MKILTSLATGACLLASTAALAAGGGTITGVVAFTGTAPKVEPLNRRSDPYCAKKQFNDETVLLSKDHKALQNVVVRVVNAPASEKAAPTQPVIVDQKECMYEPRVQVAAEGQPIEIRNQDGTLHNVHTYSGTKTLFNEAQPPKAKPIEKQSKDLKGADVVKFKCDVHPWMTGYVVVSKSPYAAVTGADGKFTLNDVPPGKYTLEAWHEKLGTQTAEVTVTAGKKAQVKFDFK